ncbi:hypothetical protein JQ543_13665 [Bradyrhizobium diazoefficiens]|nr:hypothetical protein [Bradyrhizobium diazoefficiens]MBR0848795.1 hypothetical protein [Bradyrhizobium diazoefficiens]
MPLTNDQKLAKRSMIRKGMFLTSDPAMHSRARPMPPRPDPDIPTAEEIAERLAAVRQKIEDLKAGKLI